MITNTVKEVDFTMISTESFELGSKCKSDFKDLCISVIWARTQIKFAAFRSLFPGCACQNSLARLIWDSSRVLDVEQDSREIAANLLFENFTWNPTA